MRLKVYTKRVVVAVTERDVASMRAAAKLLDTSPGELMRLAIREKVTRTLPPTPPRPARKHERAQHAAAG